MKTKRHSNSKFTAVMLFNLLLLSTLCGCGDLSRANAKEQVEKRSIYTEDISVGLTVGRFLAPVPIEKRNFEPESPCTYHEGYNLLWAEHEGLVKVVKQKDQILVTLTDPNTPTTREVLSEDEKKCDITYVSWEIGKRKDLTITAIARDGGYATAYFEYNIDMTKAGVDYLSDVAWAQSPSEKEELELLIDKGWMLSSEGISAFPLKKSSDGKYYSYGDGAFRKLDSGWAIIKVDLTRESKFHDYHG